MLDERQSAIWDALGLGPQWVTRDELAEIIKIQEASRPAPAAKAPAPSAAPIPGAPAPSSPARRSSRGIDRNVPPAPQPSVFQIDRGAIAKMSWDELKKSVEGCSSCTLCQKRIQSVFADGTAPADILLIGEAPGGEEDRRGIPFVGPSGQLLNKILDAVKFKRGQNLTIINTVKCRPPDNRDPKIEEMDTCGAYLSRQVELCDPKLVVLMGRPAALSVLRTKKSLNSLRGQIHKMNLGGKEREIIVTYHPSYLLRNSIAKRDAWNDWCFIAGKAQELNIPTGSQQA